MKFFGWLSHDQKETMAEWFIQYQQYVSTGKGLFSTITEPAKLYLAIVGVATAVVAPQFILDNKILLGVGTIFLFIVFPYFLGWWWDEKRYFRKTAVWGNKRNDMKEQMDRIEKRIEEVLRSRNE